ncbi:hypothetical protein [Methanobrevibacter sp.]
MKFKSKIFIVALFFCLIMSLGFVAAQDNTTLSGNDVKVNDYKEDNVKIYEENTNDLSSNSNDGNHYENDLNTVSNSKDQETLKDSEKTFDDVQAAIDAASSGDVIYLNGTTYNWSKTINVNTANLIIDGGFEDHAGVSILDGNGAGQIMVVNVNNITLRNIRFINGGNVNVQAGGAVNWGKVMNGTISDCIFINNTAKSAGAALFQCTNMNISRCYFENNTATVFNGGAIQLGGGSNGTISDSKFIGNSAKNSGGAIANMGYRDFNIDNCTFIANMAKFGGAVQYTNAKGNVSNSNFENNSATKRGGALYCNNANNSTIESCVFSNSSSELGGAVSIFKTDCAVENSTFSNNSANSGGGLFIDVGEVNITESAFVDNVGNIVLNNTDADTVNVDKATEEASDDDLVREVSNLTMNVTVDNYTYGDSGFIYCFINDSIYYNSTIYVIIDDEIYYTRIDSEGKGTIELPLLNAGNYSLSVIYNGTETYAKTYVPVNFTVNKSHVYITAIAPEKRYGAPVIIDVTLDPAIDGVVYIVYNGTNYTADVTDGKGEFEIFGLNAGNYTFNIIYTGNENYEGSAEVHVSVIKESVIMGVEVENITIGKNASINVSLNDIITEIDGVVYILYNDTNYTANVTGGKGTIEIPGLGIDNYNLTVIYDGDDNYNNNSAHACFSVTKIPVTMEANADNITVNDTARINVVLNPAIDGVVYIVYEGNNYTADLTEGRGTIEIPNLDLGDHTFTVYYDGDDNHTNCSAEVNLTVKDLVEMDISYANITYGDVAYINVRLPLDAHGVAYIVYGGKNYTVNLTQGVGRIEIPDLNAGNYTFDVMYSGCEKYNATSAVINLTVYKNAIDIDLNADNITFGDIARINVVLYPAINGVVYIEYGGKNYTANVTAGEGTIEIPDLEIGDYTFTVIYDESENYNASSEVVDLSVLKKDTNITVNVDNITLGESAFINVVLNPDAEGVVYVDLNGTIYTADLSEGKGTIVIPNLTPGDYYYSVIYNGSEIYNNASQAFQFTVHKHNSTMALNVTDVIYGETVSIFIKTDCPDSEVYVDINGKIYSTTLVDGEGVINIPGLNADRYLVDVSYVGNENYSSCDIPIIFTVAQLNTTTTANAATFVINYGGTYKAIVKSNNKGLVGVKVSFILNGKIIGSATTDSNGVATIKLTAAQLKSAGAGSRALTSLFAGNKNYKASSVTKKIKINKEATKFINVKSVKKSYKSTAKSMQLTATLKDSKNKVVKSQWVYFKVNNKKTYKVKTNSKGVAKLSLNAAKIKACKINKRGNYKFTVTFKTTKVYNQATKRGTLKVLR